MRRLFTIGLLWMTIALQAQDLKSLYIAIPDSLSPLLTKVNRQDFGDFLQSGMKAQVKNRFGKTSEMLQMTNDYLCLQLTSVSRTEMKLLPLNDSIQVICVANTYQGPVADTELSFYTTQWQKLETEQFIQLPEQDDFFIVPSTTERRDSLERLKTQADMRLIKADLSAKTATVQFTYTVPDYMEKESAAALRAYMRKTPLLYEWKDGKFIVKK